MGENKSSQTVVLGFKAFDLHELLPHVVAHRLGYYEERGLKVVLKDITFVPDEQLDPLTFTVACGSALLARRKGVPRKVIFVTTDYPMFWMHTRANITKWQELRGSRVATYPPPAPPSHLHRIILRRHGLDPDQDVRLEAARDDVARLGLLKSGDVQAAVLSSAIPPPKVWSFGFHTLLFFGDEIRVPTTGLTTTDTVIRNQPGLVRNLTSAFHQSVVTIQESPSQTIRIVAELINDSEMIAQQTYELVRSYFTRDGRAAPQSEENALELLKDETASGQQLRRDEIYDYSFLPA